MGPGPQRAPMGDIAANANIGTAGLSASRGVSSQVQSAAEVSFVRVFPARASDKPSLLA